MVAAWDHLFPAWFTRLHPRFRTPDAVPHGHRAPRVGVLLPGLRRDRYQEAFQLLTTASNALLRRLLSADVRRAAGRGTRFSPRSDLRPGVFLRSPASSGIAVTLLVDDLQPGPDRRGAHPWLFGAQGRRSPDSASTWSAPVIYWRGTRRQLLTPANAVEHRLAEPNVPGPHQGVGIVGRDHDHGGNHPGLRHLRRGGLRAARGAAAHAGDAPLGRGRPDRGCRRTRATPNWERCFRRRADSATTSNRPSVRCGVSSLGGPHCWRSNRDRWRTSASRLATISGRSCRSSPPVT